MDTFGTAVLSLSFSMTRLYFLFHLTISISRRASPLALAKSIYHNTYQVCMLSIWHLTKFLIFCLYKMIEYCPTNADWWQPAHIIVLLLCLGIFMCHVAMIFSIKGFHVNFILVPIYGNTGIFKLTLKIPRFTSLLVTFTALWCLQSVEEKQRTM